MSDKRKGNSTQEYQNIEEILIRKLASSIITEHRIDNNHEFNWDKFNPEILDKEKYYYRRLISEIIHQITKKCVEYAIRHRTFTTDILNKI